MGQTPEIRRIAVLSDGAWATALADLLGEKGYPVSMWCHFPEVAEEVRQERVNRLFLPDKRVSENVTATTDMEEALAGAELVVLAKPVVYLREMLAQAAPLLRSGQALLSVSKGIERETLLRAGEIVREMTGRDDVALLLGPSHAEEVARRLPTSVVAAADDETIAARIQDVFSTERFRVYTTDDTVGVEVSACVKNVIAIAAGVGDGLGFGDNSKAALITRGMAEIRRLGIALGARPQTFSGLSGIGDLITTCVSPYGRNRRVGFEIGRGKKLGQVLDEMAPAVPEGVWTTQATLALAEVHGVEMPIAAEVAKVLFDDKPPLQGVHDLMLREPKSEIEAL